MNHLEQPQNLKQDKAEIDLDAIIENTPPPTHEDIAQRQGPAESFDWNEGGRKVDIDTAKVLAKDRAESDQNAAKTLLERIKKGFR